MFCPYIAVEIKGTTTHPCQKYGERYAYQVVPFIIKILIIKRICQMVYTRMPKKRHAHTVIPKLILWYIPLEFHKSNSKWQHSAIICTWTNLHCTCKNSTPSMDSWATTTGRKDTCFQVKLFIFSGMGKANACTKVRSADLTPPCSFMQPYE